MQPSYQTKSTAQLNLCSRNPFKPHSKLKHSSNQLNHLHKSFFHSFFLIKSLTHCFTIKQATLHPILFLHVSFYSLYSNISFGNPELTPEYSHSFELNYIKTWESGHTLSLSGYYRSTDDVIQRIRFLNTADNVMYTTSENVARQQNSGLEIVGKNNLFSILSLTTTVNLYYSKLDGFSYLPEGAEAPVTGEEDESFNWNVRMIANVSLPWGVSLQGTGNYNSKRLMAQGYREPNYSVDLGLRKSFLKDKLTLSINARDLLDSRRFRTITSGDGFWQDSENWRGGRRVGFTLTYNFGNMNKKKDKSRSEEPDMYEMD